MRLVTRCPACSTTFKVVRDQLRISDGWVRCGRCSEVFDATQALWEADDDGASAAPVAAAQGQPAAVAPHPAIAPAPSPAPTFDDELKEEEPFDLGPDPPPLSTGLPASALSSWPSADMLDLGGSRALHRSAPASTFQHDETSSPVAGASQRSAFSAHEPRFDDLPSLDVGAPAFIDAEVQRREPAFPPHLTAASAVVSPIEEAVNAQLKKALRRERVKALREERAQEREREGADQSAGDPVLGHGNTHAHVAPMDAAVSDSASSPRVQLDAASSAAPEDVPGPAVDASPTPSFIGSDEASTSPRRAGAWLWALACLFALAVLALQYARHERDVIAAREPGLRPALQTLCEWTRCSLSPPRSIADISIEGASFARETDGYRLDFSLRNRARIPLAMPAVELTLLDTQERALLRRVLLPNEYGATGVLAAGAERTASLPLRLAGPDAAGLPSVAGYRLVAFYP